ncbi:MAG: diguanylate cyclase [Lautropia sp.]
MRAPCRHRPTPHLTAGCSAAARLAWLGLALLLWLAAPSALLSAAPASELPESADTFEAWPRITMLADPSRSLDIDQVMRRPEAFVAPDTLHANLGLRKESVWLRFPFQAAGSDRRWILEVDYPPLNRIEVFVVADGRPVARHVMGNHLAAAERPIRSRAHTAALDLAPGAAYEFYLRIDTTSTMIVPIHLYRQPAHVALESFRILLQGLMFGATGLLLALTLYSGIGLRDRAFKYYALLLTGIALFFFSYTGLGHLFAWDRQVGLFEKISPIGALLAMSAASLFVMEALDIRQRSPRLACCLIGLGILGGLSIAGSLLGLLDYRATTVAATLLGPMPIALALTTSIRLARTGDRIALYMVIGWVSYAIGAGAMALLLRGLLTANYLTQHLFQFSTIVEMLIWARVLGLRIETVRQSADRAAMEQRALHALANTDPLTGIPNRRGLLAALEALLAQARPDAMLAVFVIDLDGFKGINDRLGHEAGDETLVIVSQRLRGAIRSGDIVARLGGDEFVVVVAPLPNDEAALTVGRKMLKAVREPFQVTGRSATVSATIGFAMAPRDGATAAALLRAADAAMYSGKSDGRHCIRQGRLTNPDASPA